MSLLYNAFTTYFRIHERFRLTWHTSTSRTPPEDWGSAGPIQKAQNTLMDTPDGSIRLIVSPETALTSTLNVALLTLHPGREIPTTKSTGVEFYYVIDGKGSFSQQGVLETAQIQAGDCFVVHPGLFRWIANQNEQNQQDLVLLRATDGGVNYSNKQKMDVIRMDAAFRRKDPMQRLRDGLQSMKDFAKDYLK